MATADLDEQIERLRKCEYLKEQEVKALCDRAREILCEESNVQRVSAPVTVSLLVRILFRNRDFLTIALNISCELKCDKSLCIHLLNVSCSA